MSSSSSSSGSGAYFGGKWVGGVTFYDYCSPSSPVQHFKTLQELINKIGKIGNEPILSIGYFTSPLTEEQRFKSIAHHAYIVFKTKGGSWWSIEKSPTTILLQRAEKEMTVKDCREGKTRRHGRAGISNPKNRTLKGSFSLRDLFATLNEEKYNLLIANCQDFAEESYYKIALAQYDDKAIDRAYGEILDMYPDGYPSTSSGSFYEALLRFLEMKN